MQRGINQQIIGLTDEFACYGQKKKGNMSHANGQVKFIDGTVLHYEYNGTSDVTCKALYDKYEEMVNFWRNQPRNECGCGKDENVEIASDYGDGFWWQGKACKTCKTITEGQMPYNDDNIYETITNGLPGWWTTES